MPKSLLTDTEVKAPATSVSPPWLDVMADIGCVLFSRQMLPSGEISYPWISANASDIFGFQPDEMTVTSKGALNTIHWADRDSHLRAVLHSATTMSRSVEDFRAVSAAGETRWFKGSAVPRALADGRIVWDGAWLDISPWMRAEYQFQTVMDHAEDVIVTLDARHAIDWVNAAAERLFGYSLSEITGRCLCILFASGCRQPAVGNTKACSLGEIGQCFLRGNSEITAVRRDGSSFPFEMTLSEVRSDGRLSLIVIGRDITRRRTAEEKLKETERRLRTIAANLPGVVFQRHLAPDGTFSYPYISEGIEEILGHPPEDVVADASLMFRTVVDEDLEVLLDAIHNSTITMEPVREDVRFIDPTGRMRWLRGQSRPRRRDENIVWDGLVLDVTEEVEERHRAEAAVRESEERFRMAFAAASLGIVVVSLDGTIQQCNPAFRTMCHASGDMKGDSFFDLIEKDHLPAMSPGHSYSLEYTPHLPDRRDRHWRITGTTFSPSPNAPAPSLLFLVEDTTDVTRAAEDRRQLEAALQEGQKLEALGRLAGGVAHELNNMLGPILMAAEMLERTAPLDQRNRERCLRIIEASKHGRDIVRNVLAYCRKEQKTFAPTDLVPLVRQFSSLASSVLPPSVRVETKVECERAIVLADASQIHQILFNLTNNGRDAMDGQGTLTLGLRVIEPGQLLPPRPQRERRPWRPGADNGPSTPNPFAGLDPLLPHAEIRVGDSGHGMSPETVAQIFDPFFTTKPVGQGTGLGLSVVQGIIKAIGGAVVVDSSPGLGSTFRIVLPLLPAEAT